MLFDRTIGSSRPDGTAKVDVTGFFRDMANGLTHAARSTNQPQSKGGCVHRATPSA